MENVATPTLLPLVLSPQYLVQIGLSVYSRGLAWLFESMSLLDECRGRVRIAPADLRLLRIASDSKYLSDSSVRACFYWEYARSNRGLVETCEKHRGELWLDPRATKFFEFLGLRLGERMTSMTGGRGEYLFPDSGWFELADSPHDLFRAKSARSGWTQEVTDAPGDILNVDVCPLTIFRDELSPAGTDAFKFTRTCEARFEAVSGTFSHCLISIPWMLSDSELLEEFRSTLKKIRPPRFRDVGRRKKRTVTLKSLGIQERAALGWLFILRGFMECRGDWREFENRFRLPYRKIRGCPLSDRRKLRQDCAAALRLIGLIW